MRLTSCRAGLAAALFGLGVHAMPVRSQEPRLPPPGQPSVGPGVPVPVAQTPVAQTPIAQPPVVQTPIAQPPIAEHPAVRPGETAPREVPLLIPEKKLELGDQRAPGAAPTSVSVTATSPVAVAVTWVLPACAAGTRIDVGTPGGSARTFYQSDTLPVSRNCLGGATRNREFRVEGGGASSITIEPLQPAAKYVFTVAAFYRDSASNAGDPVGLTMPAPPPFTIASVNPSAHGVAIAWNETLRPTRYLVFRDNAEVGDAGTKTSYQDAGVKPNKSYSYRVDAVYEPVYTGQGYRGIPDVIVSASTTADTPHPAVSGFADTHTHPFANLASGGRLFFGQAFGPIDAVLADCAAWHGPGGVSDIIGNTYRTKSGNISIGHKTGGAPHFDGWPTWRTLTHQQMHSDWIFRAFQGGLRLMVAHAVNNALLCEVAPKDPGGAGRPPRTCDDMEAVDLQIDAAKQMENFIDMQSGGLGRGWFRIAYTPAQARQIIADGKLAVVLGIEVDKPFGCGKTQCDSARVDSQLAKYYGMGVRHLFPVHLADNAFGGFALTGEDLFKLNSTAANPGGVFGPGVVDEDCSASGFAKPCNSRGLTPLGAHLIKSMMNRGMIIDIDHMGMHTTNAVLTLTAARKYPVVGGHTGFVGTSTTGHSTEREKSDGWLGAMQADGGMVSVGMSADAARSYTPGWRGAVANTCPGSSRTMAQSYLYAVDKMGGPDVAAIGLATDQFLTNFAAPRFDGHCAGEANSTRVAYPISTRSGLSLGASKAGTRTFDYNAEGLVHFGLLPELVQDLKNVGLTDRDLAPLFRSAEGYIRVWERAVASVPVP